MNLVRFEEVPIYKTESHIDFINTWEIPSDGRRGREGEKYGKALIDLCVGRLINLRSNFQCAMITILI